MDTDELIDWVVGADEDTASMEDDDNELEMAYSLVYCDYNKSMRAVVHFIAVRKPFCTNAIGI